MRKQNSFERGIEGKRWVRSWLPRCVRRAWTPSTDDAAPGTSVANPTGRLQEMFPKQETQKDYVRRVLQFLWFCHVLSFSLTTVAHIDLAFERYFEDLEDDGYQNDLGRKLVIAWGHVYPEYKAVEFPRSILALKGWGKKRPGGSWPPIPWTVVCGVSVVMSYRYGFNMALCTLLSFDAYWRPYEALGIRGCDVYPPQPSHNLEFFCVETNPFLAHRPSKTGVYDDAVLIGDKPGREALTVLLQELIRRHGRTETKLFSFTSETWRLAFQAILVLFGLADRNYVLYSLRHGGPSHDLLYGHRSLEEARKRGTWSPTAGTLRRYEQRGHYSKELQALSAQTRQFCLYCQENLVTLLLNPPAI